MRFLPEKAADPDDGCRADARAVTDLAVRKIGGIEQARHVPSFREAPDFRGSTKIEQQPTHFITAAGSKKRVAEAIGQLLEIARWDLDRCCVCS